MPVGGMEDAMIMSPGNTTQKGITDDSRDCSAGDHIRPLLFSLVIGGPARGRLASQGGSAMHKDTSGSEDGKPEPHRPIRNIDVKE